MLGLGVALAGGPAGAVVGGREAPVPASAVMVLDAAGGLCTGVVVAPDAVLTGGHCVVGRARHRIHWRDPRGRPVFVEVTGRAVHPAYDDAPTARLRSIDLALLRTREPLPAPFAPASLHAAAPRAGTALELGGYGLSIASDRRSAGRFRSVALGAVEPEGPSRLLLWLQARERTGACNGDSGGPVSDATGVVALTAWVKRVCGGLTQATLLGPQRDWIDQVLRGWGRAARWAP